jgi:hypothetical protein
MPRPAATRVLLESRSAVNRMRPPGRIGIVMQLAAAIWAAFLPQVAFSYDHPLSEEAVRDAYFIGQDVKNVNQFLAPYLKSLPIPNSGPHVSEIELSTPFAQVVEASAQHSVGYSDQQAAEGYQKRGNFMAVRVKVLFTPSYQDPGDDFWQTISVGLIQKKQHMGATRVSGEPIYQADAYGDGEVSIGANVYVQFSLAGLKSDTLQVEVEPPGGAAVHATFDLSSLR